VTLEPDAVLVARCRDAGDEDAFAELIRRHQDAVFRLAASILGRGFLTEAEDVAQDVFLRVHHALRSFRGESQFGSWVYRITFNRALNVKARLRYRLPHVSDDVLRGAVSPARGPYQQADEAHRARALEQCVSELPEMYQAALRLHYWMGAEMSEIAALLGVPANTVKSYLHRARRLLRVMLQERGYGEL
jgi:RNA polymerase sigma-70 factor (ECF subfamily)